MPFNLDTLTDEERQHLEMKRHKTKKLTVSRKAKFRFIFSLGKTALLLQFLQTFWRTGKHNSTSLKTVLLVIELFHFSKRDFNAEIEFLNCIALPNFQKRRETVKFDADEYINIWRKSFKKP